MTRKGGNSWNMLSKTEAVVYGVAIFLLGAATGGFVVFLSMT